MLCFRLVVGFIVLIVVNHFGGLAVPRFVNWFEQDNFDEILIKICLRCAGLKQSPLVFRGDMTEVQF